MSKTALRDRALTDFDRPLVTESVVLTASGSVVGEPCLLFGVTVYQTNATTSLTVCTLKTSDASGPNRWVVVTYGLTSQQESLEGLYFANGLYADFTLSTGTFGAAFEFVKLADLPSFRPGMDQADVSEVMARARTVSQISPLAGGGGGGGGGGGKTQAPPGPGGSGR